MVKKNNRSHKNCNSLTELWLLTSMNHVYYCVFTYYGRCQFCILVTVVQPSNQHDSLHIAVVRAPVYLIQACNLEQQCRRKFK